MRAGSGRLRNRIGLLLLALPSVAFAQALPDASAAPNSADTAASPGRDTGCALLAGWPWRSSG